MDSALAESIDEQVGQDNINRKLDELIRRTSNLEAGQASIIQHLGHLAAADAS